MAAENEPTSSGTGGAAYVDTQSLLNTSGSVGLGDIIYTAVSGYMGAKSRSAIKYMSASTLVNNMTGIFGLPYQFSAYVDPPVTTYTTSSYRPIDNGAAGVGTKYNEKILSVMPVLFITPGLPVFMDDAKNKSKQRVAQQLISVMNDGDTDSGGESDGGRYYTFNAEFTRYQKYADTALRALAFYMGIGSKSIPVPGGSGNTVTLRNMHVTQFMNTSFTKLFGAYQVLPFYIEGATEISEDFSNESTESILASTVNQFSSAAKEIQFIIGGSEGTDKGGLLKNLANSVTEAATNVVGSIGDASELFAGQNLISRMANELGTIISGGKIVFPKIWGDSSYSKTYSIDMKFVSPDPDPVSIFLNVYMPIILLISLAAPRQLNNSSNSYQSPFLIRATYKSVFNIDLGLVSSLSIRRGGENKWNTMGQAYEADVSLQIEDMYSNMFISKSMGLLNNTAQMDYLATMAGVDMNEYEPDRMIKLAGILVANAITDIPYNIWQGAQSTLNRMAAKVIGVFPFTDTRALGLS